MADRPVNFSAGPAILDESVLEEASRGVLALDGVGLSILEISHRSAAYDAIIVDAYERIRRLLSVPDSHELLFLQGGARGQFAQIPLNFLKPGLHADYVLTGTWSEGAFEEAAILGDARVAASGEADKFAKLPDLSGYVADADTAYVHTTSNNTIAGTQWQTLPDFGAARHVCDMSSDIFSRPIDVARFGAIYAGAQKNAGPAGVTLVIIDKAWMAEGRTDIPMIWRYATQAKKQSMYNTPPTFAIYCVGLVAKWLEELGGVPAIAERNEAKAQLLYRAIDGSDGFYRAHVVDDAHRSRMNVSWRLADADLEKRFVSAATERGLSGLKGHRSVGGIRASIYNAMPVAGVERLVEFMAEFKKSV